MIPELPFPWYPTRDTLICSAASGTKHIEMLKVMGPTLTYYAQHHHMDSLVLPLDNRLDASRPPAWDKVVLLYRMIHLYETVIWIDCDSIICNPFHDIRGVLKDNYPMYLVRQDLSGIPNTGVWVLRRSEQTFQMMQDIWNNTRYIDHCWWEQGSLLNLMGYEFSGNENPHNGLKYSPTSFSHRVGVLDIRWNSCDSRITIDTIIKHYCGQRNDYVVEWLRSDYNRFLEKIQSGKNS